ncbi:MAG: hypothetical protein IJC14_03155 [Firmicutes bacterium]|nr:hypothetical protein [Bacillota bacterium]MBQ3123138.1 hypothetical protein [Bacillota bacterium]
MKKVLKITLCIALVLIMTATPVCAASSAYTTTSDSGHSLKYVTIDMNDQNIEPVMMTAASYIE